MEFGKINEIKITYSSGDAFFIRNIASYNIDYENNVLKICIKDATENVHYQVYSLNRFQSMEFYPPTDD